MTTIGITGHSSLSEPTIALVDKALRDALLPHANGDLVGVSCLARGADQIFAAAVLELGGMLDVVIPAADYVTGIREATSRARVETLVARARSVHQLPFRTSGPDAYLAGSKELIDRSELIFAVWDGGPADGTGGTADAVSYAKRRKREITVIWPVDAARL
ncbi:MAG: hypothetical protein J2P17_03485 [Mycobacterium sp.]|nr:hypothetical protein [Mycobacterium sp.]